MADSESLNRKLRESNDAWLEASKQANRLMEIAQSDDRTGEDVIAYEKQREVMNEKGREYSEAKRAMIDAGLLPRD